MKRTQQQQLRVLAVTRRISTSSTTSNSSGGSQMCLLAPGTQRTGLAAARKSSPALMSLCRRLCHLPNNGSSTRASPVLPLQQPPGGAQSVTQLAATEARAPAAVTAWMNAVVVGAAAGRCFRHCTTAPQPPLLPSLVLWALLALAAAVVAAARQPQAQHGTVINSSKSSNSKSSQSSRSLSTCCQSWQLWPGRSC